MRGGVLLGVSGIKGLERRVVVGVAAAQWRLTIL